MIDGDWVSAQRRFENCLRCDPTNIPSLNNLAVAELHNKRIADAVKHWKAIVSQQATTTEVVQNLGRARHLIKQNKLAGNPAVAKSLDGVYAEAVLATAQSVRGQVGFCLMQLELQDGRFVGWGDARKMEDNWSPSSAATASSRRNPAQSSAPASATAASVTPRIGPTAAGGVDPRVPPAGPYQRAAAGYGPPGSNRPAPLNLSRRGY